MLYVLLRIKFEEDVFGCCSAFLKGSLLVSPLTASGIPKEISASYCRSALLTILMLISCSGRGPLEVAQTERSHS